MVEHPNIERLDMKSDPSTEIHAVSSSQREVVESEHVRIKRPDRTSNPLVDTHSVNKIENCKHSQEKSICIEEKWLREDNLM